MPVSRVYYHAVMELELKATLRTTPLGRASRFAGNPFFVQEEAAWRMGGGLVAEAAERCRVRLETGEPNLDHRGGKVLIPQARRLLESVQAAP